MTAAAIALVALAYAVLPRSRRTALSTTLAGVGFVCAIAHVDPSVFLTYAFVVAGVMTAAQLTSHSYTEATR